MKDVMLKEPFAKARLLLYDSTYVKVQNREIYRGRKWPLRGEREGREQ